MRRALAWLTLTAAWAALYLGHLWLACAGIIGWLLLLSENMEVKS